MFGWNRDLPQERMTGSIGRFDHQGFSISRPGQDTDGRVSIPAGPTAARSPEPPGESSATGRTTRRSSKNPVFSLLRWSEGPAFPPFLRLAYMFALVRPR